MSGYYPVMLRMEGRRVVVVGGGAVAERKVDGLLQTGADVRLVSPELSPRLLGHAEAGRVQAELRTYRTGDLAGAALVFAATNSRTVNRAVAAEAAAAGIPVNLADEGIEGDFLTPAVVRRGGLLIGVTASGGGPGLAARVAREIAERYGPEWADYVRWMAGLRRLAKTRLSDAELRKRLLEAALEVPPAEWSADRNERDLEKRLTMLLAQLSGGMTDE